MALVLITIFALIVMVITCLPITWRSFNKYLEKMGYWSLLVIFIIYVFFDIWLWLKTSNIAKKQKNLKKSKNVVLSTLIDLLGDFVHLRN